MSPKQETILKLARSGPFTLSQAAENIGSTKHNVGAIISSMIKAGLIDRVKPGEFKLGPKTPTVWKVVLFRSRVRSPYWRLQYGRRVLKRIPSESGGIYNDEASFRTLKREADDYEARDWRPSSPQALKPSSPQALRPSGPQALKPSSPQERCLNFDDESN